MAGSILEIDLLRVDDLLSLHITARNLRLDADDRAAPVLVVDDSADDAVLIVRFPPQTIFEQAYLEEDPNPPTQKFAPGDPQPDPSPPATTPYLKEAKPPGDSASRLGSETRLVFRVPPDARIPYTVAGLLDWSTFALLVAPIADVAAGATAPPAARTIRAPADGETTLQLPFRLHLSPTSAAGWQHATTSVGHRGRVELWHTRLSTRDAAGSLHALDEGNTAGLRAIWSPDYREGEGVPLQGPTGLGGALAPMSISDRHQIVVLTSAFEGYAASVFRGFVPTPVEASLVMLSPLGGWLRSYGRWDPPALIKPSPRTHVRDIGDLFGPVLHQGVLPADRPAVPEHAPEVPGSGPKALDVQSLGAGAPLRRREIDVNSYGRFPLYDIDETAWLDVSEWAHVAAQGRDHYVRLVYEGKLSDTGHKASLVKVTERRIEQKDTGPVAYLRQYFYIVVKEPDRRYAADGSAPRGRGMPLRRITLTTRVTPHLSYPYAAPVQITGSSSFWVQVQNTDFLFHGIAEGADGEAFDFAKALVFVPNSEAQIPKVRSALSTMASRIRLQALVPGQRVAFADAAVPGTPGNTVLATESFMLGDLANGIDPTADYAAYRDAFFEPTLLKADVHIPAVEALTGSTKATSIALQPDFVADGFAAGDNATGAFATIVELVEQGGVAVTEDADSDAKFTAAQAGGFATPSQAVTTLTRAQGPLGGKTADARSNTFNAADVFPKGEATLFGVFDLASLLPAGGLTVDGNAPKMTVQRDGAAIVTDLDWASEISDPLSVGLVQFIPAPTTLDVHVHKRLEPGGAAATTVTGSLTAFDIAFLESLVVKFASFNFEATTGRKTDVHVALDPATPVQFVGDLVFVEGLRSVIPPGVFGDGVSIDIIDSLPGIRAGIAISLPPAQVGVFGLKNIAFAAGLTIPFVDGKPVVDFSFARRDAQFLLSVLIFGGGGFFHVEIDTDGVRMLEAGFEFGATAALDIGVASGEVHIMAGIYFAMAKKQIPNDGEQMAALLSGYLRCGGSLSVLGIVRISVEFYLSFTYYFEPKKAKGRATLTVEVEIACFSTSVDLTVEKSFGGEGSDPSFGDQFDTPELWADYADVFR